MLNLICADSANNAGSIVIYAILIVVLIAMLIMPYFTQKKKNQEFVKMLESIKVGDLVKTAGGIIGKVKKITDKGDIKTVILETGSKTEKSYMEFDLSMVYCVLKSTKVETESSDKKEIVETKVDDVEEKTEVLPETVEEKTVEKPKTEKKTTTKKTTAKKSTTKKSTSKK